MWGTMLLFSTTCHPQTDRKMEVGNQILSPVLRALVSRHLKNWDLELPHTEFAYNLCNILYPFEACYGVNPLTLIDFIHLPIKHRVSLKAQERAK